MRLRAGLDIGGTKTAALIVDEIGRPLAEAVCPTDVSSPAHLVDSAVAAVDMAITEAGADRSQLVAAGVGVPGQVNAVQGLVRLAVNLNLNHPFPLADALRSALGVPVALENDVRAAAWGAYHWLRHTEPIDSLAYLSIGTGIAAGLVLNGCLYRGAHDMAGEIGHISVDPAGPRCNCGAYGCLEAMAAGPAIAAYAAELFPDSRQPVTTRDVFRRAMQGDEPARRVIERVSYFYARAVYLLVMTYDVEKVVIGGGVTGAGQAFEEPFLQALANLRADSDLAAAMLPGDLTKLMPAGQNAGLMGAVLIAPVAVPEPSAGR
jgi:glucokinase